MRMIEVRQSAGHVTFLVRVQPNASRSELAGEWQGALRVRLAAPPLEDRANDALRRFLADRLSVPLSAVRDGTRGEHSPQQARRNWRAPRSSRFAPWRCFSAGPAPKEKRSDAFRINADSGQNLRATSSWTAGSSMISTTLRPNYHARACFWASKPEWARAPLVLS